MGFCLVWLVGIFPGCVILIGSSALVVSLPDHTSRVTSEFQARTTASNAKAMETVDPSRNFRFRVRPTQEDMSRDSSSCPDPGLPTPKRWKRLLHPVSPGSGGEVGAPANLFSRLGVGWSRCLDAWNPLPDAAGVGGFPRQSGRRGWCGGVGLFSLVAPVRVHEQTRTRDMASAPQPPPPSHPPKPPTTTTTTRTTTTTTHPKVLSAAVRAAGSLELTRWPVVALRAQFAPSVCVWRGVLVVCCECVVCCLGCRVTKISFPFLVKVQDDALAARLLRKSVPSWFRLSSSILCQGRR